MPMSLMSVSMSVMAGEELYDQAPLISSDATDTDPVVWDMIVVGAGVAGATLAAVHGKLGRRVLLLERDLTQPNRIVGELLQPGGFLKLKALGLEAAVEDIDAQKVYGYGLFKDGEQFKLQYPKNEAGHEITGRSFHHGRFVQRLRQLAVSEESVTLRQGTVKALIDIEGKDFAEGDAVCGVRYRAGGTDHIAKAHLTIVCDGMYSSLRRTFVEPSIKSPSHFVGIVLENCTLPYPNYGHVVLGKPTPMLFYPIGSSEVRCLIDVPAVRLPNQANGELQAYLLDTVAAQIPETLQGAFKAAVEKGDIRSVQNKQMSAQPVQYPGALVIGDAYNMRHPLTGGGMTVALSDCKVLSDMLSVHATFEDVKTIEQTVRRFHLQRKPLSCTINTLANALYQVFSYTGDEAHEEMRQACFDYLSLGGEFSAGPISLLSGLNPRPTVLVRHFFQVALFGVQRVLRPPSLNKIWRSVCLLLDATFIILPIVRDEGWNMLWSQIFLSERS